MVSTFRCSPLTVPIFGQSTPLLTPPLIRGTYANFSGLAPRHDLLRLAGYTQLVSAPSRGVTLLWNVGGDTLITQGVGSYVLLQER